MPVSTIGVLDVGARWQGATLGHLRALIPLPVNSDACLAAAGLDDFADSDEAWDQDFDRMLELLLSTMDTAAAQLVVATAERSESLAERLLRLLPWRHTPTPPATQDAASALSTAARDDQYLKFASLATRGVTLHTADGHPIVWVWTTDDTNWHAIERLLSRTWPTKALELDIAPLNPPAGYSDNPVG